MNKYGFTLIEMLATITILSILTVIVIVSATNLMETNRNEYYHTQENMMVLAAEEYFLDYRSYLPKTIGEKKTVLLQALIAEKYMDQVVDNNDKPCDEMKSYVEVEKIANDQYGYQAVLVCDGYETEQE